MIPISPELADQLKLLNPQQLAFLAGYAWAKSTSGDAAAVSFQSQASAAQPAPARRVRILSASQTGNARKVAEQLLAKLESGAALMLWLLPNVAAHDLNSVESFRSRREIGRASCRERV